MGVSEGAMLDLRTTGLCSDCSARRVANLNPDGSTGREIFVCASSSLLLLLPPRRGQDGRARRSAGESCGQLHSASMILRGQQRVAEASARYGSTRAVIGTVHSVALLQFSYRAASCPGRSS